MADIYTIGGEELYLDSDEHRAEQEAMALWRAAQQLFFIAERSPQEYVKVAPLINQAHCRLNECNMAGLEFVERVVK